MRLHRAFRALAALVALTACEKNAIQDLTGPVPSARIRFFNFGVNAPNVHFYTGNTKLTASTSASCQDAKDPPVTANDSLCVTAGREVTTGVAYGGVSSGGWYVGIEPGQYTFDARLLGATDKGTTISSVPLTVAAGKSYSYFVSGIYNTTTKKADAFIVEDEIPANFDWTATYLRFVNAISNGPAMTLRVVNTVTGELVPIGGATAYKGATAFVKLPEGAYDLNILIAGSSTPAVVRANVGLEDGAMYTITARGDWTVTSSTATNRPVLDFTINR